MTDFSTTDLQEFCSGSGRLSLGSLYAGFIIAFPVDFRYQWDLRLPQHRKLLDQLDSRVSFYAPRCGPWSSLSNWHPAQTEETIRKEDEPFLQWIAQRSKKQYTIGNASVVENPQKSSIFKKSPLSSLVKHPEATCRVIDHANTAVLNRCLACLHASPRLCSSWVSSLASLRSDAMAPHSVLNMLTSLVASLPLWQSTLGNWFKL